MSEQIKCLGSGHAAFGFGDEVDVFDRAFLKGNGLIRVVVACASRNQETARWLGADNHFGAGIQFFDEIPLNFRVGIRVIVNVFLKLIAVFAEVLLDMSGSVFS